jgi:hypothetical protein
VSTYSTPSSAAFGALNIVPVVLLLEALFGQLICHAHHRYRADVGGKLA